MTSKWFFCIWKEKTDVITVKYMMGCQRQEGESHSVTLQGEEQGSGEGTTEGQDPASQQGDFSMTNTILEWSK